MGYDQERAERRKEETPMEGLQDDGTIRLNRYLAHCGLCSRREADAYISRGDIKVNQRVVTALGTRIRPGEDQVTYRGKTLQPEQLVYILYNKQKNIITTASDPQGRKTVIDIIQPHVGVRVYPVGRLDRNTTGLLLLTNDGVLAKKLTHPSHKIRKIYKVKLDQPLPEEDMEKLLKGIKLEDGLAKVDKISYVPGKGPEEVGLEIHIGKNRIVRRLFEALGYQVVGLDRTSIAHLTKKQLPRGKWRTLTDKEVSFLKML